MLALREIMAELFYKRLLGAAISQLLSGYLQRELTLTPTLLRTPAELLYKRLPRAAISQLLSDYL